MVYNVLLQRLNKTVSRVKNFAKLLAFWEVKGFSLGCLMTYPLICRCDFLSNFSRSTSCHVGKDDKTRKWSTELLSLG